MSKRNNKNNIHIHEPANYWCIHSHELIDEPYVAQIQWCIIYVCQSLWMCVLFPAFTRRCCPFQVGFSWERNFHFSFFSFHHFSLKTGRERIFFTRLYQLTLFSCIFREYSQHHRKDHNLHLSLGFQLINLMNFSFSSWYLCISKSKLSKSIPNPILKKHKIVI